MLSLTSAKAFPLTEEVPTVKSTLLNFLIIEEICFKVIAYYHHESCLNGTDF